MFQIVRTRISYPVPAAQATRTLAERMALANLDARRIHALAWMRQRGIKELCPSRPVTLPNPPF